MISKLVVWGEDRTQAIARLRRVLGEYRVAGVRTTLPFFRWLVGQSEFSAGAFDTTYLDDLLASRKGQSFVEPTEQDCRDAALVAGISAWFRAHQAAGAPVAAGRTSGWRRAAREEGRR
jgi:acetyl/propionyl-CoA carboxylase alpha subunit